MIVEWLNPGGGEQTPEQLDDAGSTTIGLRLDLGIAVDEWKQILVLFNPHDGDVPFALPDSPSGDWTVELSTADPGDPRPVEGQQLTLAPRSLLLLRPS